MKLIKVGLLLVLSITYTIGQQPDPAVKRADYYRVFWDGWWVMANHYWKGLRYTETRGDWVLTVESDQNGAARATYVNAATGYLDSECIVIGETMYERSGNGPWTQRTRAEYKAEQIARGEALTKARAAKDSETHRRIFASGTIRATNAAMGKMHVAFSGQGGLHSVGSPSIDGAVTSRGMAALNGRAVRMFSFTGANNKLPPTVRGDAHKILYEIDYWIDEKTGAIAKARSKKDEIRGTNTTTEIVQFEFHIDHSLAITPPITR